jgi:phosphate transport system permease protein
VTTDTLVRASTDAPRPIVIPKDRSLEDKIFRGVARGAGFTAFIILFLIGFFLLLRGLPALRAEGWKYFTTSGYSTLRKP